MKAAAFDYVAPASLPDALAILSEGRDAKVLAGGQSLVAALNMRLSAPEILVDINRIEPLQGIDDRSGAIRIGALARHRDVASSPLIAARVPLVAMAMRHVAHPAIRNRGTTCGSLAYADPSAEMPACAVALDATLTLQSMAGTRSVKARDFFLGLYDTLLQPDEILTEALFPQAAANERFGFDEVALRHGDFPAVGVAVCVTCDGPRIAALTIVVFGSEPKPLVCRDLEPLVAGQPWGRDLNRALAEAVAEQMDPMGNFQGRPETRRRQAKALVGRVLDRMMTGDAHVG